MARSLLKQPLLLEKMLNERRQGASLLWLAARYRVDHTTIIYHCRRHNVQPTEPLLGGRKRVFLSVEPIIYEEDDAMDSLAEALMPTDYEPRARARGYLDYLRDAMNQPEMQHYFNRYKMDPLHPRYSKDFHLKPGQVVTL